MDRMLPGSTIYFTDDTHFIILTGGIYYDTQDKIDETVQSWRDAAATAEQNGATYLVMDRPQAGYYADYPDGVIHRIYDGLTLEEAREKAGV